MPLFEHYLYVVKCADESLYTGYAANAEARLAQHNAGKGAKYTRTRLPVSLVAKARFFTKQRAMSAEFHFKQLSRKQKEQLLDQATRIPFERVLVENLPRLNPEPIHELIARELAGKIDPAYRDFQSSLIPTLAPERMAGVRTPALRKLAKALAKRDDIHDFLKSTPHSLFEENQLHAFVIAEIREFDEALAAIEAFLPLVDNWATCDQLWNKALAQQPERMLEAARAWMASGHVYTIRFGVGVLLRLFLDELFQLEFLDEVVRIDASTLAQQDEHIRYVDMMRAWYFAEAVAKQPEASLPYLLEKGAGARLDEGTRRKAIQKSIESLRVPDETKDLLRAAR